MVVLPGMLCISIVLTRVPFVPALVIRFGKVLLRLFTPAITAVTTVRTHSRHHCRAEASPDEDSRQQDAPTEND